MKRRSTSAFMVAVAAVAGTLGGSFGFNAVTPQARAQTQATARQAPAPTPGDVPERDRGPGAAGSLPKTCESPAAGRSACLRAATPEEVRSLATARVSRAAAAARAAQFIWPEWCEDLDADGEWYALRFESCRRMNAVLVVLQDRVEIGRIEFDVREHTWLDISYPVQNIWAHDIELEVLGVQGVAIVPGTTVSGSLSCTGPCDVTESTFPAQLAGVGSSPEGIGTMEMTEIPEGWIRGSRSSWTLVGVVPGVPPTNPVTFQGPQVRCDDIIGNRRPGCVFPQAVPDFRFPDWEGAEFFRHVLAALESGLPSRLHRISDARLRALNGATACPPAWPRPADMDCDEYPFRSTREGAFTSRPNGGGRTFPWCGPIPLPQGAAGASGWSSCFIDRTDNRRAGSLLGTFYSDNRVIGGNAFDVVLIET